MAKHIMQAPGMRPGAAYKSASGAKRIKHGDGNTTSAKRVVVPKTGAELRAEARISEALAAQRKTENAAAIAKKKGFLTQNETQILQTRTKSRKPAI